MFESTPAHTESPTPLVHTRAPRTLKHSVVCDFQVSDEGIAYARASARPRTPKQCVTRLLICYFRVHTRAHKVPYSVSAHPRTGHFKAQCRMLLRSKRRRQRPCQCQCTPTHTEAVSYATVKSLKAVHVRKHTRAHKVPYSVSAHPCTAHLKAQCRMRLSSKR